MKIKFWISYKIKRDFPNQDIEDGFYIYSTSFEEAKKEAIEQIKNSIPFISRELSDEDIEKLISINQEETVMDCSLCGEILDLDKDYIIEVNFQLLGSDESRFLILCWNCWYDLDNYLSNRALNYKRTEIQL